MCSTWGINNTAVTGQDTRGGDYVPDARVCELENLVFEKIRQKTKGASDEGKTIHKIFRHFDIEGYGTITCGQFIKALETLGCYFKPAEY